jgi:hypothetical protein
LRAICYEMNETGLPFIEAIEDLNIIDAYDVDYSISILLANGFEAQQDIAFSLCNVPKIKIEYQDAEQDWFRLLFNTSDVMYDKNRNVFIVDKFIEVTDKKEESKPVRMEFKQKRNFYRFYEV